MPCQPPSPASGAAEPTVSKSEKPKSNSALPALTVALFLLFLWQGVFLYLLSGLTARATLQEKCTSRLESLIYSLYQNPELVPPPPITRIPAPNQRL